MTEEELAEMQKMITAAAGQIESKLAGTLQEVLVGVNAKVEAAEAVSSELQVKAKAAFEALPALIQKQVENQLQDLTKQLEEKAEAMSGGGNSGGGGAGVNFRDLLAHSDKIIGVINAWKQPTTEAAMMGQMNLIFRWHGLLSKLEKGGGSGDDVTKAIADTFKPQE